MKFSISELRKRHKMTQTELAKKVGVSVATIVTWENGGFINAKLQKAYRVADVLKVDLSEIKTD